jgi:hypothetical protein
MQGKILFCRRAARAVFLDPLLSSGYNSYDKEFTNFFMVPKKHCIEKILKEAL